MLATTEHRPFYDGEWVSIFSTGQRYTWVEIAPGLYDKRFEEEVLMETGAEWGECLIGPPEKMIRRFQTGATRDTAEGKPQFSGYLSPLVLKAYGAYMLRHQKQADGQMRAAGNWKKGMPEVVYLDSAERHLLDWHLHFDGFGEEARENKEDALCALIFNASGALHEMLKGRLGGETKG